MDKRVSEELGQLRIEFKDWGDDWVLVAVPPDAAEIKKEFPAADREVLRKANELLKPGYPVTRGAAYLRNRRNGVSDSMAALIAMRKSPMPDTDDVFFSGLHHMGHQMCDEQAKNYINAHRKHTGRNPPEGAIYMPGLARFQGDPEAFVNRSDGRTYIKRLIESRGGTIDREMNVTWNEPETDPFEGNVPLAEDLVRRQAAEDIKENPDLGRMTKQEMRERITEKHGASA